LKSLKHTKERMGRCSRPLAPVAVDEGLGEFLGDERKIKQYCSICFPMQ
jgi:hypothetical protein